jgi:hypothetical protein
MVRLVWGVGTLGIGPLAKCGISDESASDGGYLCNGQHGAMQLLMPVAGPFLFAAHHPHDSVINDGGLPLSSGARALLYTSGFTQAAGLTLALSGFVFGGYSQSDETRPPIGPNQNLLTTGTLLAGTVYAGTLLFAMPALVVGALVGIAANGSGRSIRGYGGALLAIPLAGPFMYLATQPHDDILNPDGTALSTTSRALLIASGAAQAAGLALMASSLLFGRDASSNDGEKRAMRRELHVAPIAAAGTVGLSIAVSGW